MLAVALLALVAGAPDADVAKPSWAQYLPQAVRDLMRNSTLNRSAVPWTSWTPPGALNKSSADDASPFAAALELLELPDDAASAALPFWAKYLPQPVRDMMAGGNGTLNRSAVPWNSWTPPDALGNSSDTESSALAGAVLELLALPDGATLDELPHWVKWLPKAVHDKMLNGTFNHSGIPPWMAGAAPTDGAEPKLAASRTGVTAAFDMPHLALAFAAGAAFTVAVLAAARRAPRRARAPRPVIRLRLGRRAADASDSTLTRSILSADEDSIGGYAHL
ncbi:hypothetical protein KFE25_006055 [Diacronema lutheri]|uniref:Cellulase n=1 Tax=Diacronema lutheri TaxID=2081491 RepID=A0A8J5Y1G6_DIALT|nr:hypothetical protein KFE25_006055 [Diacronema lutheri]